MKLFFLDFIGSVGNVITFIVFCGAILWAALLYDENKQLRRRSVRSERDIDYEGRYLFVRDLLDTEENKVDELTKKVKELEEEIVQLKKLNNIYSDIIKKKEIYLSELVKDRIKPIEGL